MVFDGIYKKLEMELHQKKREMQAVIEDSKNAYEAREKAQNEMLALKHHAEKEKNDFENEVYLTLKNKRLDCLYSIMKVGF